MAGKLTTSMYTAAPLHEDARFARFWELVAQPAFSATTWGRDERATESYASGWQSAHRQFRSNRTLFIRGAKDGALCSVQVAQGSLFAIHFWINAGPVSRAQRRTEWIEWLLQLAEAFPVLFGYSCTKEEYEAKHRVRTAESSRAVGVSLAELGQFLPGVYWMTMFGRELVSELELDKGRALPGVEVRELAEDQVVLLLDEPPVAKDMDARLAVEAEIADALGEDRFFDRARPDRVLQAVPAFAAEIRRLKTTPLVLGTRA